MTVIDCPNITGAKAPTALALNTPLNYFKDLNYYIFVMHHNKQKNLLHNAFADYLHRFRHWPQPRQPVELNPPYQECNHWQQLFWPPFL